MAALDVSGMLTALDASGLREILGGKVGGFGILLPFRTCSDCSNVMASPTSGQFGGLRLLTKCNIRKQEHSITGHTKQKKTNLFLLI